MINKNTYKLENYSDFLEYYFSVVEIESDYLCNLVVSVLSQIIESTGNDEIDFNGVREAPTISEEAGEVTENGEMNLDSTQLRKYDDDVAMAIVAH